MGSELVAPPCSAVDIAELVPPKGRGSLVGSFQRTWLLDLVAYISNWWTVRLGLDIAEWRWQLGKAFVPALLFLILLYSIPHSSRFSSFGYTSQRSSYMCAIEGPELGS